MDRARDAARQPRTDAQRNRTHILVVAEQWFAEQGVAGSMDAIAKRAGIGAGTLYRHFPNRESLLAALLAARDEELKTRLEEIRKAKIDSTEALALWLDALSGWVNAFEGLPEPLRLALSDKASPLALTCEGFISTTEDFLRAAQRDGGARPDVHARELFLGALATAWVSGAAMADASSAKALRAMIRSGWATVPAPMPKRPGRKTGR